MLFPPSPLQTRASRATTRPGRCSRNRVRSRQHATVWLQNLLGIARQVLQSDAPHLLGIARPVLVRPPRRAGGPKLAAATTGQPPPRVRCYCHATMERRARPDRHPPLDEVEGRFRWQRRLKRRLDEGLRWDDVEPDQQHVNVNQTWQRGIGSTGIVSRIRQCRGGYNDA